MVEYRKQNSALPTNPTKSKPSKIESPFKDKREFSLNDKAHLWYLQEGVDSDNDDSLTTQQKAFKSTPDTSDTPPKATWFFDKNDLPSLKFKEQIKIKYGLIKEDNDDDEESKVQVKESTVATPTLIIGRFGVT